MMRIELDSVRKTRRSTHEWRTIPRASCNGLEVVSDGEIIAPLCRLLIEAGHSGPVEVWRGKTPVFHAKDVSVWASGKALRGEQPEHLRKSPA